MVEKILRIIRSCETVPQMVVAGRVVSRYLDTTPPKLDALAVALAWQTHKNQAFTLELVK